MEIKRRFQKFSQKDQKLVLQKKNFFLKDHTSATSDAPHSTLGASEPHTCPLPFRDALPLSDH